MGIDNFQDVNNYQVDKDFPLDFNFHDIIVVYNEEEVEDVVDYLNNIDTNIETNFYHLVYLIKDFNHDCNFVRINLFNDVQVKRDIYKVYNDGTNDMEIDKGIEELEINNFHNEDVNKSYIYFYNYGINEKITFNIHSWVYYNDNNLLIICNYCPGVYFDNV